MLAIVLVGSIALAGCSQKTNSAEELQDREVCKVLAEKNKDYKSAFESEEIAFREQKIRTISGLPGFLSTKVREYVEVIRKDSTRTSLSSTELSGFANVDLFTPIRKTCLKLDIRIQELYKW